MSTKSLALHILAAAACLAPLTAANAYYGGGWHHGSSFSLEIGGPVYYGPPAYPAYYPAPVYYGPAPVAAYPTPVAYLPQPPQGPVVPTPDGRYCREYSSHIIVNNHPQASYGTACLMPDGAWQIQS